MPERQGQVVLFGVTTFQTAQAFLTDQLELLVRRGHEVHLACDGLREQEARAAVPLGVHVWDVPSLRQPSLAHDLRTLRTWIRVVRRVRPTTVVASTPKAGLLLMAAAWLMHVPVRVYHLRGLRAEGLAGFRRVVSISAERAACWFATARLCDSKSLKAALLRFGISSEDAVTVLGQGSCCGVDVQRFRPPSAEEKSAARARLAIEPNAVVFVFVGRVCRDKGVFDLVEAFQGINLRIPAARLVVAGPVELGARELIQWDQALDCVGGKGLPALDDPLPVYWAGDVFCLPSKREGFPIAPLEAQACGLPLITTDATGCVDSLIHGQSGIMCGVGDVGALRAAIETVALSKRTRDAMGSRAREWVCGNFDASIVNVRFVEFIERLSTDLQRRLPENR